LKLLGKRVSSDNDDVNALIGKTRLGGAGFSRVKKRTSDSRSLKFSVQRVTSDKAVMTTLGGDPHPPRPHRVAPP